MQTVLTIGGFDPSSGAGVSADLMVFAAHGLFGTACITALTVQNTVGVRSTHSVEASTVGETLDYLDEDMSPIGVKIGMLASQDNIRIISEYLHKLKQKHECIIVLDPVLRSSSGKELVPADSVRLICEKLLTVVDWVTPNIDELAVLVGQPVESREAVPGACRELQNRIRRGRQGQLGVFATGGHLDRPDDFLLSPEGGELWLPGERVATRSTHGTGCALSSAFLARLVLGDTPENAAHAAKDYVAGGLRTAKGYGSGRGPLNHLWLITNPIDSR